jgi:hypothetical protein
MAQSRPIIPVLVLGLLAVVGLGGGWLVGRARSSTATTTKASAATKPAQSANAIANSADTAAGARSGTTATDPARVAPAPTFVDVAAKLGIEFNYERGETGEYWLPETMGGGVGWLDFDGDGLLDLYLVQGCQLPKDESGRFAAALFRNRGNGKWEQVPREAAPANSGYGMGVAAADVNDDGFDDLYVTNFGLDTFWINNGDGTFRESGVAAGLGCPLWGTSAAFADLDRDGDLDLFVANYLKHDPAVVCTDPVTHRRKYCGPDYMDGEPSVLFENLGDGRFKDISMDAGIVRTDGKGLGVVIADLIGDDAVPEIFVANDLRPNFLFRSVGSSLQFEEIGFEIGAAVNAEGVREANMGIACGDYDEDGDLDLYVTHYYMEHDTLWENQGPRGFADVTKRAGVSLPTLRQLSWGTNFVDFDNNGWLDLFVTSGHINDGGGTMPYAMPPQLFRNLGSAGRPVQFTEVSVRSGDYFLQKYVGRSSAAADFDRDGRIDLAVGHHHKPAAVLRNETASAGNAIGFILAGRQSNRSAIGARVTVVVDEPDGSERRLVREVIGGGSYLAADSRELLIGIGPAAAAKSVEIRWPSGYVSRVENLNAGGYWLLSEIEVHQFRPFAPRGVAAKP